MKRADLNNMEKRLKELKAFMDQGRASVIKSARTPGSKGMQPQKTNSATNLKRAITPRVETPDFISTSDIMFPSDTRDTTARPPIAV